MKAIGLPRASVTKEYPLRGQLSVSILDVCSTGLDRHRSTMMELHIRPLTEFSPLARHASSLQNITKPNLSILLCMMPIPGPVRGPARPLSRPVSRQPVDLQIRRVNDIMAKALKEPAPEVAFTVDDLALAGQQIDRSGLTKAGRALDKHGNRPDSPFPKATGTVAEKKMLRGSSR